MTSFPSYFSVGRCGGKGVFQGLNLDLIVQVLHSASALRPPSKLLTTALVLVDQHWPSATINVTLMLLKDRWSYTHKQYLLYFSLSLLFNTQ